MLLKFNRPRVVYVLPPDMPVSWLARVLGSLRGEFYTRCDPHHGQWAINEVIEGLPKNPGAEVYIPYGHIDTTDKIVSKHYVKLGGSGPSTQIHNNNVGGEPTIEIDGTVSVQRQWTISDMLLLGNASSGDGIKLNLAYEGFLQNLYIVDHGGNGVDLTSSIVVTAVKVKVDNSGGDGVHSRSGCNALSLFGCRLIGNTGDGLDASNFAGLKLSGGTIESNVVGVRLSADAASSGFSITGVYFEANSTAAILKAGNQYCAGGDIKGNYIKGHAVAMPDGIDLQGQNTHGILIGANSFLDLTTGINLGANVSDCQVFPSLYLNVTTAIVDAGQNWVMNPVTNKVKANEGFVYRDQTGFPLNDTTPSVAAGNWFITNANVPTAITQLDDGENGQVITIQAADANTTIADGGNFRLAGNWTPGTNDTITLIRRAGTLWIEKCRSNN